MRLGQSGWWKQPRVLLGCIGQHVFNELTGGSAWKLCCTRGLLQEQPVPPTAMVSTSKGTKKWEKGRCHKKAKEKEKEHSKVGSKQCVGTCLALFEAGASVELYVACCSLMLIFFVCSVTLTCFSCGIFGMHLKSRYAIPQPQAKGAHLPRAAAAADTAGPPTCPQN